LMNQEKMTATTEIGALNNIAILLAGMYSEMQELNDILVEAFELNTSAGPADESDGSTEPAEPQVNDGSQS